MVYHGVLPCLARKGRSYFLAQRKAVELGCYYAQNHYRLIEIATRDMMTDIVISPLHGRDIQTNKKKPHYQKWSSNSALTKSSEQVKALLGPAGAHSSKGNSIKGQIRLSNSY